MLDLPEQGSEQLQWTPSGNAYQDIPNVCPQRTDAIPKSAAILLLRAIDLEARHELPTAVLCVRFAPATADSDDLMPGSDQSRDQVRSYMSGTTNDDDTHDLSFFVIIRLDWEELKNSRSREFEECPKRAVKNWVALDHALLSPELLQLLTPWLLESLALEFSSS